MTEPADLIDGTRDVRRGEELDRQRLASYLRDALGDARGDGAGETGEIRIEQFPGGHSNLTYLINVGDAEYVLRRPPFGTRVKSAHDMGREYRVLSALAPVWEQVPRPILLCDDPGVIGAPFYLMERTRGLVIRQQPPAGLDLTPALARGLCESFVDALAKLHDVDIEEVGLTDFGRPDGYVRRQVEGWAGRYQRARTDDVPAMERVAGWLLAHLPENDDAALIHNDFKLDNLILDPADPTRILAILDWEMATVGHPLMDLGTALAYWVEAGDSEPMKQLPFGPTRLPGMMTRAELVARYQERTGVRVESPEFYYAFGLWKTAVVAQQIYYRYAEGHTRDPRFAAMITGVRVLAAQAASAIDNR